MEDCAAAADIIVGKTLSFGGDCALEPRRRRPNRLIPTVGGLEAERAAAERIAGVTVADEEGGDMADPSATKGTSTPAGMIRSSSDSILALAREGASISWGSSEKAASGA